MISILLGIFSSDPEYAKFLKLQEIQDREAEFEVYANAKLHEYKQANTKPTGKSKILNNSLAGISTSLLVLFADKFGVTLSPDETILIISGISVLTNAANYYFRKYKTTHSLE